MVAHELIINYSITLTISERKQNEKDKKARYHGKGKREVGRTEGRPVRQKALGDGDGEGDWAIDQASAAGWHEELGFYSQCG